MRVLAAAAAILLAAPTEQDPPAAKESLFYRIYSADREIGGERVEFDPRADRLFVRSELTLRAATGPEAPEARYVTELQADPATLVPRHYQVRARGPGGSSEFSFEIDEESVRVTGKVNAAPIRAQEGRRSPDGILFDGATIAHMAALLRTLAPPAGGRRTARATLTADLSEVELVLEDKGEANLIGPGAVVPVRRIFVGLDPIGLMAYVSSGRLVLFRNPFNNTRVALDGFERYTVVRKGAPLLPDTATERETSIRSGDLRLEGSVVLPREPAAGASGVLILGAPGAVDRDGNTLDLKIDLYRVLAYDLAAAGFVVLRYDKRGVGRSGGDLSTATLNDLVEDAEAALRHLKGLKEVGRVSIVGHSEGGVIAGILASRDGSIRSLALLAAPALPMDEILLREFREGARRRRWTAEQIEREAEARRRHFERIREARENWMEVEPHGRIFIGWLREHFQHDPLATLARVRCPIRVAQGMKDTLIHPDNADRIERALKEAQHPAFEVVRFEKLDHTFVESEEGAIARFAEDRPIDPGFLAYLVDALSR